MANIDENAGQDLTGQDLAEQELRVKKKLFRAFCPDSMEIYDYVQGALPEERAALIRAHLQECPHCRREMAQTRTFLEATSPNLELSLAERVRNLVAHLVHTGGGEGGGWALAAQGVRGQAEHVLTYETEGMQIILDVQADPERTDLRVILGLLIGAEAAQKFQARMLGGSGPAVLAQVNEDGNFTFLSIAQGEYELALAGPEVTIHIEDLVIE